MNVAIYLRKSREEEQETREETLARHERIWNLSAADKNKLLKSIIDRIEYTKTERNTRYNTDEVKFTLKIFLKIYGIVFTISLFYYKI